MSHHLDALAAIATASEETGRLASDQALLILQQTLGLRDAHICRVEEPGGVRWIQDSEHRRTRTVCTLPEPRWQQSLSEVETEEGRVASLVIRNPPGQAVLHLTFAGSPDRDDLAASVVAAALLAGLLPADDRGTQRDAVTGLSGRATLERFLLDRFTEADRSVSLIITDVNGLKAVNDRFGHRAGDRLLRRVGAILAHIAEGLGTDAVAARIGGDEFAIAAAGTSSADIEATIEVIDAAAGDLGDGTGLARGYARLDGRAPGSPSPGAAVRGLLALADAQLYLHKASLTGAAQESKAPPETARAAGALLARLETDLPADESAEKRLVRAAELIAEEANAAAWWLSRRVDDTVVDVDCGKTRDRPLRWDEPERPVTLEPRAYLLDDFTTTRRALAGESFSATLTQGAESERSLLAYFGYRSVIGAGGSDETGDGWLIEIYGDYLTGDLPAWGDTLLAAVTAALGRHD